LRRSLIVRLEDDAPRDGGARRKHR
jgi:hypothetical protein